MSESTTIHVAELELVASKLAELAGDDYGCANAATLRKVARFMSDEARSARSRGYDTTDIVAQSFNFSEWRNKSKAAWERARAERMSA